MAHSDAATAPALVTVIILCTNERGYLEDCLGSLARQTYGSLEIVVVDNNSHDDTGQYLRDVWPAVTVVRTDHNVGYARGNNLGAGAAKGDYLFLLNPDTIVDHDCVALLVASMSDGIGACAPKLLLYPDTETINSDGNEMNFLGVGWANAYGEQDARDMPEDRVLKRIPYPTGAAALIRTSIFRLLGGLDEDFFMYHEDTDLGLRIRLMGYEVICNRAAVVYHKYNFKKNSKKWIRMERNRLVMLAKIYRPTTLLAILPALVLLECGILFRAAREGWLTGKLGSYAFLVHHRRDILRKRQDVQRRRVVPDAQLLQTMRGGVYSREVAGSAVELIVNPLFEAYFWVLCFVLNRGWIR